MKLSRDGKRFKRWLEQHFELSGCWPLGDELIREYDHLVTLRAMAQEAQARGDDTLYLKLCNAIAKSSAAFIRLWRTSGLSTIELPAEIRNATNRR